MYSVIAGHWLCTRTKKYQLKALKIQVIPWNETEIHMFTMFIKNKDDHIYKGLLKRKLKDSANNISDLTFLQEI